jgi:hypothetical protein
VPPASPGEPHPDAGRKEARDHGACR